MPRRTFVLATCLAIPALAAARDAPVAELGDAPFVVAPPARPELAPEPRALAVRLVWTDPASAALGTEAVVRPEVSRLLRGMGLAASWRRAEPHETVRPGELRVIFLDRASARAQGAPVLGATPLSFAGDRFVWVHVPSVRAAAGIGSARPGSWLGIHSARGLGIALARVVAHEVVHALAPALPHSGGLMAARLDERMLTAANIRVDPAVGLALRQALAGQPQPSAPQGAVLAAESSHEETYR